MSFYYIVRSLPVASLAVRAQLIRADFKIFGDFRWDTGIEGQVRRLTSEASPPNGTHQFRFIADGRVFLDVSVIRACA